MMNTRKIITVSAVLVLSLLAVQAQQQAPSGPPSPGGVAEAKLKLWLRADDTSTMTLTPEPVQNYTANPQATIAWINILPSGQNPSTTQTVVNKWTSVKGTTEYNHNAQPPTGHSGQKRKPVYLERHYLMNYHPTVDFYSHWRPGGGYIGTVFASTLTSNNMPMSTGKPTNSSTIAVMNAAIKNGFSGENQNMYFIYWHDTQVTNNYTHWKPTLGIRNNAGEGQGRLRVEGRIDIPSTDFTAGETTIADYQMLNAPSNGRSFSHGDVQVGFNMKYYYNSGSYLGTVNNNHITDWHMNGYSSLGSTYAYLDGNDSRAFKGMISEIVQYEGILTLDEENKINSYFAIKYGITLRPRGNTYKSGLTVPRFDYKLSNDKYLWKGATGGGVWTTFYNNLAAVVRDDNTDWHNRQAHSTNVGSIVHLGVPSTTGAPQLYFDGNPAGLGELQDDEAVMVGNDADSQAGVVYAKREECGNFEYIFKRKWLVHKVTNGERPVTLLVGAQDNAANGLGQYAPANVQTMYDELVSANDVVMIVADSPEKLTPTPGNAAYGEFTAVVPMQYLNGEHQCMYTFTDSLTYFTFGYIKNSNGCAGEVIFTGTKTLDWNQWTRNNANRTFYDGLNSTTTKTLTASLGDGLSAKTTVAYAPGVRADRYFPSVTNSPRGALDLVRHSNGGMNTPVTATIEFTKSDGSATPLMPEFFVSGLDSRLLNQWDKVTIRGYCGGRVVSPELTYAGNPSNASYRIDGHSATVKKGGSQSATAANGRVNVAFKYGVDKVVVEYTLQRRASSLSQHIYISPLTIKPVPPPMLVNEDGLAFVKEVKRDTVTTCEENEYVFYIKNVNTAEKYVNFSDTLPAGLKWHTLTLDSINGDLAANPKIIIHNFAGTDKLIIDSMLIPCVSTIKFTATVKIDDDFVPINTTVPFDNHSRIDYEIAVESQPKQHSLPSMDRFTHAPKTRFAAKWAQKQDSIIVSHTTNYAAYLANREIEVTLTVKNRNTNISNMFLNLSWDAGFKYKDGSYGATNSGATVTSIVVPPDDPAELMRTVAGSMNGQGEISGFTLPSNETVFKFTLIAPAYSALEHEYDEQGTELSKFAALHLDYEFVTEQNDPCLVESLNSAIGEIRVPYNAISHIMVNKHITTKIKR